MATPEEAAREIVGEFAFGPGVEDYIVSAVNDGLRAVRERVAAALRERDRERDAFKATAAFTKKAWDDFADELRRITQYTGPDDGDQLLAHVRERERAVEEWKANYESMEALNGFSRAEVKVLKAEVARLTAELEQARGR